MLKKDFLNELATKKQTTLSNVLREYVQNVFLRFLYQNKQSQKILFKGGTALKIAYGSPRFSEDLDFTLNDIPFDKVEKVILGVLNNLEKEGFKPEIIESKETTGGYLGELIVNVYQEKTKLSIQGSQRKKGAIQKEVKLIVNDFIPDYQAYLLKEDLLISEKINAALTRSKPRDFFDIYFLLRGGHIPVDLRNKLIEIYRVIKEKDINYEKNLSYLLPQSMQDIAKSFPEPLLNELRKYTSS
jgi:predicted nucleotidyltransferase component of viral defense system